MELIKIRSHVYFGSEAVYFNVISRTFIKQLFLTGILSKLPSVLILLLLSNLLCSVPNKTYENII